MSSEPDIRRVNCWKHIPKVELHCHFLGVIDPYLLAKTQSNGGKVLVTPELLKTVYPVSDLEKFRKWLNLLKPYQKDCADLMRPFLAAHIANLIEQNVVYSEIMLSPVIFPRDIAGMVQAVREWREWTLELEQRQIQIEYLMVIPRSLGANELAHDVQAFIELRRANLIVGVALVGIETGESIKKFADAFAHWRDVGLGIEIHAGEHRGIGSVYDALEYGRPQRIGHCLSAFQDTRAIEVIKQSNVHVEFCPTSNICTAASADLKNHQIKRAFDHGVSFSINTDNPGTFGCSVEEEFQLIANSIGFGNLEFEMIYHQALAARFEPKLRYLSESSY